MEYNNGFQYWPMVEVDGSYPVQDVIFFPSTGYLGGASPSSLGSKYVFLSHAFGAASAKSKARGILYLSGSTFNASYTGSDLVSLHGMSVRCISEQ